MRSIELENDKETEADEGGEWLWLPEFDTRVYLPDLKTPKTEQRPRSRARKGLINSLWLLKFEG
jgi:hypothetical protein